MRFLALSLLIASTLAACQATSPEGDVTATAPAGINQQAYAAHKVTSSVSAFSEFCLADTITINRQKEIAERHGLGAVGPTRLRIQGRPALHLSGVHDGEALPVSGDAAIAARSLPIEIRRCSIGLRGEWADVIAQQVLQNAREAGFRILSSAARETQAIDRYDGEAVRHMWTLGRNGKQYRLIVQHGSGGTSGNTIYVSGTGIALEAI